MWWIGVHVGPGKRFRVLRKLGTGVCSTALLAHDADRDCQTVLKVFDDELARDRGLIQRLEREAKRQSALDLPGTGPFLGHFRRGDSLVLYRDYVDGISFADWLGEENRRAVAGGAPRASTERAVELFESIVGVMAAAHEAGLWHLGLVPSNLFVESGSKALRVVDFGIAQVVGYARYAERRAPSPYLAPEQSRETQRIDPRIDVFGLGALLHALLAGNPEPAPLDPRDARPPRGRRAALLELVRRATHDEPRQRPGNAPSLRRAFAEVLAAFPAEEDEAGTARPTGSFTRSEATDPTWRRPPSTATAGSPEGPSPEWMRIETPLATRPLSPGEAESGDGPRAQGPADSRPIGRSRDPLFDTSGSLQPIGLETTVPRMSALSAAHAAAALAGSEEDAHRATTAERPAVAAEAGPTAAGGRGEEPTLSGAQPAVETAPSAPMAHAPAPLPAAEPAPTTMLRVERIRAAIQEEVEDTPPPGHPLLVGDAGRSADATVAMRAPEARPALGPERAPSKPGLGRRRLAVTAVPLLLGAAAVAWLATRDTGADGAPEGDSSATEAAVPAVPSDPTEAAAGETHAVAVLAESLAEPAIQAAAEHEADELPAAPLPEPDPVGLLSAAGGAAAAPPTVAELEAAHAAVLQSEAGGVHFDADLWSPGNSWVMRVHDLGGQTAPPDYFIRRTVLESAPHPWGTRVLLREEGGTAPPRLYDFIASASCLIRSESREILFCMPPRENERQDRPVADTVASAFRLPAASGEVVFDPDLGWIEERPDATGQLTIELAGYRVGRRQGGDVDRPTPSCHWDERVDFGPGIGRNDEPGVLSPEMREVASWGVQGRLRRIDLPLTGPHGFGQLRAWYSRYTAAYRLEPVVGPADRPAVAVPLPVADVWRWAPPNGPEHVLLHFARDGVERLDLLTLGPGPEVREQTLLPETVTGTNASVLTLVPGPTGCTLMVRQTADAAPSSAFDLGIGAEQ